MSSFLLQLYPEFFELFSLIGSQNFKYIFFTKHIFSQSRRVILSFFGIYIFFSKTCRIETVGLRYYSFWRKDFPICNIPQLNRFFDDLMPHIACSGNPRHSLHRRIIIISYPYSDDKIWMI